MDFQRQQRQQSLSDEFTRKQIRTFIESHGDVLARKLLQSIVTDDYGVVKTDKWVAEVAYFVHKVLPQHLELTPLYDSPGTTLSASYLVPSGAGVLLISVTELFDMITAVARARAERLPSLEPEDCDALDFERYCARILDDHGWITRTTKGSGDQGVDVIAARGSVVVAIQCKKYSSAVGNAAVQEAFAGMHFHGAHRAAVVTNATFTPSARQLAGVTGVMLLHYSELDRLAAILEVE